MTNTRPLKYENCLRRLMSKLSADPHIEIEQAEIKPSYGRQNNTIKNFPELLAFYGELDEFAISWHLRGHCNPNYAGGTRIVSSVYFDDPVTPIFLEKQDFWQLNGSRIHLDGKFFPIDIIEDSACAGVFASRSISTSEVFFYDFGIDFYSLKTNWWGYIQLLEKSLAIRYWQTAILSWEYEFSSGDLDVFIEMLEMLSPELADDNFKKFYLDTIKIEF